MKTRDVGRNPTGFWARLGAAIAAAEMTPVEFLEIRVGRLEREMSRLIEAGRRRGNGGGLTDDETEGGAPNAPKAKIAQR